MAVPYSLTHRAVALREGQGPSKEGREPQKAQRQAEACLCGKTKGPSEKGLCDLRPAGTLQRSTLRC